MALRIDAADFLNVGDDVIQVVRRKIEDEIFRRHG
jgi:hypothetical protein